MATFGYTSFIGNSVVSLQNNIRGSKFTLPEFGTASIMTAFLSDNFGSPTLQVTGAIYNSASMLVAKTQEVSSTIGNFVSGAFDFPFIPQVELSPGDYILVLTSANLRNSRWDAGSSNQGDTLANTYANGFPTTASFTTNDNKHAVYVTYTPSSLKEPGANPQTISVGLNV